MTNEGTAGIWWADTIRTDRALIALAMLVGLLLGSTLTALAMDRILDAGSESVVVAKQWPAHALDREWRGTRTPVDVDRMFRSPLVR